MMVKPRYVADWLIFSVLVTSNNVGDFGCLSGPPGFTCWISFAPVFSLIYC